MPHKKKSVRTGPEEAVSVREFKGLQSRIDRMHAEAPPQPTYQDSVGVVEQGMTLFDHQNIVQVPREETTLLGAMREHHDVNLVGKPRIKFGAVGELVDAEGSTYENITLSTAVPIVQHANTWQEEDPRQFDGSITYCGELEAGNLSGTDGYWLTGIAVAGPMRKNPLVGLSQPGTTATAIAGHFFPVCPRFETGTLAMRTSAKSEGPEALGTWTLVRADAAATSTISTGMTNLSGNLTSQTTTVVTETTLPCSGVFFTTLQPGLTRRYVELTVDVRNNTTGQGPQFEGIACSSLLLAIPNQLVHEDDVDETYPDYINLWNEWDGDNFNKSGTILGISGMEYPFARMANFKGTFQQTLGELNEHQVRRKNKKGNFSVVEGCPDQRSTNKFTLRFDRTPFALIISNLVRDSASGPGRLVAKFRSSISFSSDSQRFVMVPAPLKSEYPFVLEIWAYIPRTYENEDHKNEIKKALRKAAGKIFTKKNALRAGTVLAKALPAALALI